MRELAFAAGVPPLSSAPSKSGPPLVRPRHAADEDAHDAAATGFSSLDLLAANHEGGLPGLLRLLEAAQHRDPHLLNRPMQDLLSELRLYLLHRRQMADGQALKRHLLNSGIFLDALLAAGMPAAELRGDLKALLNKALQRLLPHQVLTGKSGGTQFEYDRELTAQILLKHQHAGQKAIIRKLLQTEPLLNEYQQNAETPDQGPVTHRHLATWLGHAVEEALCHIVQQQLHSFSDENQQLWRFSLYAERHGTLLTVPVEIRHDASDEASWLASFTLQLEGGASVKVSLQLQRDALQVHLETDDFLTQQRLARRQDRLRMACRLRKLELEAVTTATVKGDAHGR